MLKLLLYTVNLCMKLFYSVCHLHCLYSIQFVSIIALNDAIFLYGLFFQMFFSIMPRCKSWKWSCWQLLMYLEKWWWILSVKINQLPKVASASSSSLLALPLLPFLISTIHCCHAWISDCHHSTPFSFTSPHLTLTPQPPEAPVTPSIPLFPHALSLILP